jgi:hypothetical protein
MKTSKPLAVEVQKNIQIWFEHNHISSNKEKYKIENFLDDESDNWEWDWTNYNPMELKVTINTNPGCGKHFDDFKNWYNSIY